MGHQRDRGTKTRLLEANKRAAEFYAAQLRTPEAAPAMAFLTARGFDAASAERFGCGYAPAGWDALTKHLLAGGFSFEELEKAGLSRQGNRGPMDRFHRRLLWPIRDRGGEVVGFGARRIYDDDRVEAKYLNTAETPVYRKTHVLFGLDLAKSRDRQAPPGRGRRGLHRRDGDAPRGRAHGRRVVRHRVRGRAHRRDQKAHRRRLVRPRRGHLHLRRRRRGPGRRAQGVRGRAGVHHADLRHDRAGRAGPLRAAAEPGRHGRARPRGPPRADLRVRDPLGAARVRPRLGRGPGGRAAAHGAAGRPDQARGAARRVRPPPRGLGQLGRHRDGRAAGAGDGGRAGRAAGRAARWRRRPRTTPACTSSGRRSRRRCRCPAIAGPSYDELPEQAFTHPAFAAVHRAVQAAGGVGAGLSGQPWLEAVAAGCTPEARAVVSELAVEPMELPRRTHSRSETTRPATWRASSPGCGSRWWRPRWPS